MGRGVDGACGTPVRNVSYGESCWLTGSESTGDGCMGECCETRA